MQLAAWLISVVITMVILSRAQRYTTRVVLGVAVGSIVAGMVFVTIVGLGLRHFGIASSHAFVTILFQALFAVCIVAMLNIMNRVTGLMVDAQIAFHRRYNAANLNRFPVRFVIANDARIKAFGALFWSLGAAMMFYGLWFHMKL